jgi:hypothetical protein
MVTLSEEYAIWTQSDMNEAPVLNQDSVETDDFIERKRISSRL